MDKFDLPVSEQRVLRRTRSNRIMPSSMDEVSLSIPEEKARRKARSGGKHENVSKVDVEEAIPHNIITNDTVIPRNQQDITITNTKPKKIKIGKQKITPVLPLKEGKIQEKIKKLLLDGVERATIDEINKEKTRLSQELQE